jgi:hypothetical protein
MQYRIIASKEQSRSRSIFEILESPVCYIPVMSFTWICHEPANNSKYISFVIITSDDSQYISFVKSPFVSSFLWLILVSFATFLGLRFPPTLVPFISPRKIISRISLLVLLFVMSALLRLL